MEGRVLSPSSMDSEVLGAILRVVPASCETLFVLLVTLSSVEEREAIGEPRNCAVQSRHNWLKEASYRLFEPCVDCHHVPPFFCIAQPALCTDPPEGFEPSQLHFVVHLDQVPTWGRGLYLAR